MAKGRRLIFFFLAIILGLVVLYCSSFTSPFFQDDFELLSLARQGDAFMPIPNFPYRPLAIQVFYSIGSLFSGTNPLGFHLLSFLFFVGLLAFIYLLAEKILGRGLGAKLTVVLYAFNISLFPLFYWVATSYFALAAFFVFGGAYFYLRGGNFLLLATAFFVLGLLSNELVLVFPGLLYLLDYVTGRRNWSRWLVFLVIDVFYFVLRFLLSGMPTAPDYALNLGLRFFATFRWYFLRIFNLPEGVRLGATPAIYLLFVILITILLVRLWQERKRVQARLIVFSGLWFFFGALPFYFLPGHMSAYYLTLALFGPSVFVGKLLDSSRKTALFFCGVYILLAVLGLDFLSQTHWIILKPTR